MLFPPLFDTSNRKYWFFFQHPPKIRPVKINISRNYKEKFTQAKKNKLRMDQSAVDKQIQMEGWKKEELLFSDAIIKYSKMNRNHQLSFQYVCNLMQTATIPCGFKMKRLHRAEAHIKIKSKHFFPLQQEDILAFYENTKSSTSKYYIVKITK